MALSSGRILIIASAAYPLGGVAVWTQSLLLGLSKIGWDCCLGLTIGDYCDPQSYLSMHPWAQHVLIENPTGTREGRIRALRQVIIRESPDCLIVLNTPDAYVAASRIGSSRPRVIMALHGIEPQFYADLKAYSHVIDAVAVPSRLAFHLVEKFAEYPAKYADRIPAGVEIQDVNLRSPASPLDIVYAGRLERDAKRIQDIPPILRRLDQCAFKYRLWVAGEGTERNSLTTELQSIQGEVHFLGVLRPADVLQEVFKPGRVLLITSERETGPLVAWEAMSRGMLVVTSTFSGLRAERVLEHKTNALLFPVGDHETAAAQLMRASDPRVYLELARAGVKLVRSEFSSESMISRWNDLLLNVMSGGSESDQKIRFDQPPDGRLAKWLGNHMAENVRRALGRSFPHSSAGGEWPHSYGNPTKSHEYAELVSQFDAPPNWRAPSDIGQAPSSP